MTLLSTSSRK